MVEIQDFDSRLHDAQREVYKIKTSTIPRIGWSPRLRQSFGYYTPDECYEALVYLLVTPETRWLDVGCGHNLFASNPNLALTLSNKAKHLVGLDPDSTIEKNPYVKEKIRSPIEQYDPPEKFDLITLRMVAEHLTDPLSVATSMRRLLKKSGNIIIYTVNKWSPSSVISSATPISVHHVMKKILWKTNREDTFPTEYKMNTRDSLRKIFESAGLGEKRFWYLDDCRSFGRWEATSRLELHAWRTFRRMGLHYPEVCLLGVYGARGTTLG